MMMSHHRYVPMVWCNAIRCLIFEVVHIFLPIPVHISLVCVLFEKSDCISEYYFAFQLH